MARSKAYVVGAACAGALVLMLAAGPFVLPAAAHAAGFGSRGIEAGSWAAALMRSYGGAVPPGSICAVLQRVGIRGVSTYMSVVMEATAIAMAAVFYTGFRYVLTKQNGSSLGLTEQSNGSSVGHASPLPPPPPPPKLLTGVPPECCGNLIDLDDEEEEPCDIEPLRRQQIVVEVDPPEFHGQKDGSANAEHGVSENTEDGENASMSKAQASVEVCHFDLLL